MASSKGKTRDRGRAVRGVGRKGYRPRPYVATRRWREAVWPRGVFAQVR